MHAARITVQAFIDFPFEVRCVLQRLHSTSGARAPSGAKHLILKAWQYARRLAPRSIAGDIYQWVTTNQGDLACALRKHQRVEVNLDNTEGFAASFIDEAFRGLVRINQCSPEFSRTRLVIVATEPGKQRCKAKILEYILGAAAKEC